MESVSLPTALLYLALHVENGALHLRQAKQRAAALVPSQRCVCRARSKQGFVDSCRGLAASMQ